MNSKITLEKFRQYKEKIMEIEYSYDENEAFLRCFNLQKEILKYDLSDIPFEEWEGMTIYADNENRAFFSGTNANIDFSLVEYFGNAEFHGCNIKNLEKIDNYINSNDFDDYIIKKNKNLFLVGNFDDSFKEKFYSFSLTIDDILNLNEEQVIELEEKNIAHFKENIMINCLGIRKIVLLYNYSKEKYNDIRQMLSILEYDDLINLKKEIDGVSFDNLENVIYNFFENLIINTRRYYANSASYPLSFVEAYPDLFMINTNIPEDVKNRFINKELTLNDILEYQYFFENTILDYFMNDNLYVCTFIRNNFGLKKFQELVFEHDDVFSFLNDKGIDRFNKYLVIDGDYENSFCTSLKNYLIDTKMINLGNYFESMNFKIYDKINSISELLNCNNKTIILDEFERNTISMFGIDNIKKLEEETNLFSANGMEAFNKLVDIYKGEYSSSNEKLNYKEFISFVLYYLNGFISNYDALKMDLMNKYSDLFIDFNFINNGREELEKKFALGNLTFDEIKKYPELVNILLNKNLEVGFRNLLKKESNKRLLIFLGNEEFLKMCSLYGKYLDYVGDELSDNLIFKNNKYYDDKGNVLGVDDVINNIEMIIVNKCKNGEILYDDLSAPLFIIKDNPELFLSNDAPYDLKKYFYNYSGINQLTFTILAKHPEWKPFLEGKLISASLLKNEKIRLPLKQYFGLFGNNSIKFGINRFETIERMINLDEVFLMKEWYDRTGHRFIPDHVVMENFALSEVDKFLDSGTIWSSLMRLKDFSINSDVRKSMLKIAYSFGAFDHDQKGIRRIFELLTYVPKKVLNEYDIDDLKDDPDFLRATKIEQLNIDFSKKIFNQFYRKSEDSYTFIFDVQKYPLTVQAIRKSLEKYDLGILSAQMCNSLFNSFDLIYDSSFREFMLENIDIILHDENASNYLHLIQKNFNAIKKINSNRKLTWNLAVSYVSINKYKNIDVGNEMVASISSIAGYSDEQFNILQKIYNYGKQRVFSSIPRIENNNSEYSYEMLRLDDPLAMAIGTLTNCCQELGGLAEFCVEHSMISKNGRIFVVRDKNKNIIAQSWVWRNKNGICFDNIEIPNKVLEESDRKKLTSDILEIYKKVASELIEMDNETYSELFNSGKITKKQYDELRLGKVTVGLGYNDIAEAICKNSSFDKGKTLEILPFQSPVLNTTPYRNDSRIQYVLEQRDDYINGNLETLPLYNDTYIEYDDSNFSKTNLYMLGRLEQITKGTSFYLGLEEQANNIVSSIALKYNFDPLTTKIILHPNFAIIYNFCNDTLKIGDLLFNTSVSGIDILDTVILQIHLALEQICPNKKMDLSRLNEKQVEMIKNALDFQERRNKNAKL